MGQQKRLTASQIRKQQLVVEGLMYRSRILESKQAVKDSKLVEWFADDGVEKTTHAASSWIQLFLRYRTLMPIALSGVSIAARWIWRKPLLYSGLIASALVIYQKYRHKDDNPNYRYQDYDVDKENITYIHK